VAMATAAVEAASKSISNNTAAAATLLQYIKKLTINQYSGNSGSAAACGDNDRNSTVHQALKMVAAANLQEMS